MKLIEWTKHYVKFKDCMKRQIKSIEEKENYLIVHEKKEDKIYCVSENLKNYLLTEKNCQKRKFIVTLNTKQNVHFLSENWNIIREKEDISIIFANPKTNENWIVHPNTHSKITEDKLIKQSLMILYEGISNY